jgi:hypothetical protein
LRSSTPGRPVRDDADGLPYIGTHRRYPRHLCALGYGGNGMTFGFLAAQNHRAPRARQSQPPDHLVRFQSRLRRGPGFPTLAAEDALQNKNRLDRVPQG